MSIIITEKEMRAIDDLENLINKFEELIFDNGIFSAPRISEKLKLEKYSESFEKSSIESITLGQQSYSTASLLQKKDFYISSFGKIKYEVIRIRNIFKPLCESFPENERFKEIFERNEKCAEELKNLYEIVRNFN